MKLVDGGSINGFLYSHLNNPSPNVHSFDRPYYLVTCRWHVASRGRYLGETRPLVSESAEIPLDEKVTSHPDVCLEKEMMSIL
jgi:hypothetical protein